MAGTQPHYHISRLKRPHKHKYSQGGIEFETKHRHTGHATIHGASFEHVHKHLHTLVPQHPHRKHAHAIREGHRRTTTQHRTSQLQHQHRVSEHHIVTHANRHEAARRAIETKRAKGEKIGFTAMTPEARHQAAVKAAATRRSRGEKPFAHISADARRRAALRAAATRRARHER